MVFKLAAKIDLNRAPETEEERLAVRQLKGALNQLGYYIPDPRIGMHDDIDEGFRDSIYAYRRKNTIFHDDTDLGPNSTTERLLAADLEYKERDHLFTGTYIWRTVGDEKVRGQHAMRNGQTFSWAEPLEGGHPSEDYNCRCWAEHTNPPYHPWMEWVNERRNKRLGQSAAIEKLAEPRGLNEELINDLPAEKNDSVWPILILFGALLLFRAGKLGLPALQMFLRRSSKNAYEIALEGGKHAIFLKGYKNVSSKKLEKGIRSFDKQIDRHFQKIKNPEKEYPDFKNLDKRQQKALLEKKWPSDIKRLEEQKEILRRILNERN